MQNMSTSTSEMLTSAQKYRLRHMDVDLHATVQFSPLGANNWLDVDPRRPQELLIGRSDAEFHARAPGSTPGAWFSQFEWKQNTKNGVVTAEGGKNRRR